MQQAFWRKVSRSRKSKCHRSLSTWHPRTLHHRPRAWKRRLSSCMRGKAATRKMSISMITCGTRRHFNRWRLSEQTSTSLRWLGHLWQLVVASLTPQWMLLNITISRSQRFRWRGISHSCPTKTIVNGKKRKTPSTVSCTSMHWSSRTISPSQFTLLLVSSITTT